MDRDYPSLVMVNFGMTDTMGHSGSWSGYTNAIRDADTLTYYLWLKIQNDTEYKDKTTMFVTNDHGRHLDGVKNGFQDHGDDCEGCRHVMMLAIGPDTKAGAIIAANRQLIDIAPTIGYLMGFNTPFANGNVMSEMLTQAGQQQAGQTYPIEPTVLVSSAIIIASLAGAIIFLRKKQMMRGARIQKEDRGLKKILRYQIAPYLMFSAVVWQPHQVDL